MSKILNKIDELKMMVILDEERKDSEPEKFDRWVDMLLGKRMCIDEFEPIEPYYNKEWIEFSHLKALVSDLFYKKHSDKREYHKNKPEIRKIISEVVAMTMYCKNQSKTNL